MKKTAGGSMAEAIKGVEKEIFGNEFEGKRTQVIACYWGVGKHTFWKALKHKDFGNINYVDLRPSDYMYLPEEEVDPFNLVDTRKRNRIPNREFPKNYIRTIQEYFGRVDYIFVSSSSEIQSAMWLADINFTLVYPGCELKNEAIGALAISLYERDKSPDKSNVRYGTLTRMIENFDMDVSKFDRGEHHADEVICLARGEYLTDVLMGEHLTIEDIEGFNRIEFTDNYNRLNVNQLV